MLIRLELSTRVLRFKAFRLHAGFAIGDARAFALPVSAPTIRAPSGLRFCHEASGRHVAATPGTIR